jgi:SepF-like predicted cell division protein (DUF552 family)
MLASLISSLQRLKSKDNNMAVKHLLAQTEPKPRGIPEQRQEQQPQEIYLKTICIHNNSRLSELIDIFLRKELVILIARISPIAIKDPEARIELVSEIYKQATKNDYSVFRLGEERIIVVHRSVKVEDILAENSLLSS